MLTITLTTDNAAFDPSPHAEVARILLRLAQEIAEDAGTHANPYSLRDYNGNLVGTAELEWLPVEPESERDR